MGITIKDLSENLDLDRKAMQDIHGGSRYRLQTGALRAGSSRSTRIVDFRTGAAGRRHEQPKRQPK